MGTDGTVQARDADVGLSLQKSQLVCTDVGVCTGILFVYFAGCEMC